MAPLSYQWQFNGTNLAGAESDTLTLTNVQSSQSGNYSVILSNAAGTNSAASVLTVLCHQPQLRLPCMDNHGAFSFLLTADTGAITLSR